MSQNGHGVDQQDFDAAMRMIERWRKRSEEQRSRINYLEGAVLGLASAEKAEEVIAGGPGKRETDVPQTAPRFVCLFYNVHSSRCGLPAPRFYYSDPDHPLCDEHAAEYKKTPALVVSVYERCTRCWRTLAPEHAAKYDAELCWTQAQTIPKNYGANGLADFHQAMSIECRVVVAKRKGG